MTEYAGQAAPTKELVPCGANVSKSASVNALWGDAPKQVNLDQAAFKALAPAEQKKVVEAAKAEQAQLGKDINQRVEVLDRKWNNSRLSTRTEALREYQERGGRRLGRRQRDKLDGLVTRSEEAQRKINALRAKLDAADVQDQTPVHNLCRYARQWCSMVITETRNGMRKTLPNPRYLQHTKVLKTLLEKGADPKLYTSFGYSPLHLAAENGAHEFIPLLVEKGADVNTANPKGYTPMHAAADRGHVECLRALLEAGAKVDPIDDIGFTPLFGAVLAKSAPSVELLLQHGASIAVRATGGYQQVVAGDTVVEVAKKLDAGELVALLSGKKAPAQKPRAAKKPAAKKPAAKKKAHK